MTTEKSIEAFREVVEKLEWFLSENSSSGWVEDEGSKNAQETVLECMVLLTKFSFYFPRTISSSTYKVLGLWHDINTKKNKKDDVEELAKMMHNASNETMKLIERIQEHVGVDKKES